ncbi:hypothetical protein B0O99DRAFT_470077, partial [Bisporella sp. PMI_857]
RKFRLRSRVGCHQCKRRKIKCDEQAPACQQCVKHRIPCSFTVEVGEPTNSTTREPGNGSSTTPAQLINLELIHHFATSTCLADNAMSPRMKCWQTAVIKQGFKHDYLLHSILTVSAFHIASLKRKGADRVDWCFDEQAYLNAAYDHYDLALPSFRQNLQSLNDQNCHALVACSILIFVASSARQAGVVQSSFASTHSFSSLDHDKGYTRMLEWISLIRGVATLVYPYSATVKSGSLGDLIRLDPMALEDEDLASPSIPKHLDELINFLSNGGSGNTRSEVLSACRVALVLLQRLYARLGRTKDRATGFLWAVLMEEGFVGLLREKVAEAQIVLAYFCVLLLQANGEWWVSGLPAYIIGIVARNLMPGWDRWLRWPLECAGLAKK